MYTFLLVVCFILCSIVSWIFGFISGVMFFTKRINGKAYISETEEGSYLSIKLYQDEENKIHKGDRYLIFEIDNKGEQNENA